MTKRITRHKSDDQTVNLGQSTKTLLWVIFSYVFLQSLSRYVLSMLISFLVIISIWTYIWGFDAALQVPMLLLERCLILLQKAKQIIHLFIE